jgi:hypothetical protein
MSTRRSAHRPWDVTMHAAAVASASTCGPHTDRNMRHSNGGPHPHLVSQQHICHPVARHSSCTKWPAQPEQMTPVSLYTFLVKATCADKQLGCMRLSGSPGLQGASLRLFRNKYKSWEPKSITSAAQTPTHMRERPACWRPPGTRSSSAQRQHHQTA